VIDYQRQNGADRTLTLDIVDYPGEWLLDLPLLNKSFEQWSARASRCRGSRCAPARGAMARAIWHAGRASARRRTGALTAARLFTDYLRACRDERFAMSLLPPGRFLMPGNLAVPGADLCAARRAHRRRGAGGFAVGDDGAAL
jgi:predicted YcjX-like family ATPase